MNYSVVLYFTLSAVWTVVSVVCIWLDIKWVSHLALTLLVLRAVLQDVHKFMTKDKYRGE